MSNSSFTNSNFKKIVDC